MSKSGKTVLGPDQSAEMIGLRLKALRLALGFKFAKQFAETFGASPQQLSNYENGENRPDVWEMIHLVSRHGGATLDWIYLARPSAMPYDLGNETVRIFKGLGGTFEANL